MFLSLVKILSTVPVLSHVVLWTDRRGEAVYFCHLLLKRVRNLNNFTDNLPAGDHFIS
jgi:hypothetical protein